jgi:hypothetical protein
MVDKRKENRKRIAKIIGKCQLVDSNIETRQPAHRNYYIDEFIEKQILLYHRFKEQKYRNSLRKLREAQKRAENRVKAIDIDSLL